MRNLRFIAIALFATLIFSGLADAQRRSNRGGSAKPPAATIPPLDVRAAREKTDNQLANVNTFVDKLGPVAQGLEDASAAERDGQLKPETARKIDDSKARVVETIRNLKAGLSDLESEYRTKPALAKYLPTIQGITDLASRSEDSAIAGKFVAAKDPLRDISKKLADTLALLPR